MVAAQPPERLFLLDWFRYLAVLLVCLNHLSVTLLRFPSSVLPPALYVEPARAAIAFLFTSSGFFLHLRYADTLNWRDGRTGAVIRYISRRLWILLPPVLLALAVDLAAGTSTVDANQGPIAVALPSFLSLTQAWSYRLLGNATTTFPFGSSNLAWFASDLFFLSIVYLGVRPLFCRLRPGWAWVGLLVIGAGHGAVLIWLRRHAAEVKDFGVMRFGLRAGAADTPAAYTFGWWLVFYSPYARAFEFLVGLAFAQIVRQCDGMVGKQRLAAAAGGVALIGAGALTAWSWGGAVGGGGIGQCCLNRWECDFRK